LPPGHAIAVCEAMIQTGMCNRIRWYAYCSPVPFTAEMAATFKRAGCAGINFGVDSGSDAMLAQLSRCFRTDDIQRTASICRAHSIPFMFDLLIGAPGETPQTVCQTLEFVRRLGPDCVGISLGVRIYPGTPLASQLLAVPHAGMATSHSDNHQTPETLEPVFYMSPELGTDAHEMIAELVRGDERFFLPEPIGNVPGYNYNENQPLMDAIRRGARGAYWDILRRLRKPS
ncbi:MAG: radical SAM protein, partial [Verrucomicrobiae bacterium]|nr:radical SAM protein [Verrucomicrobiae bacterium]